MMSRMMGRSLSRQQSMTDMFEKGRVFVKDLLSLFERPDGTISKCPRCRGTGLLQQGGPWLWGRPPSINDPCLFCEGVGIMPLYGLRGFMAGRASAAVKTELLRKQVDSHIKVELYLGKYPGTKCKFRSQTPSINMSNLLHEPHEVPEWLMDVAHELAPVGIASNGSEGKESVNLPNLVPEFIDEPKKSHRAAMRLSMSTRLEPSIVHSRFDEDMTKKSFVNGNKSRIGSSPFRTSSADSKSHLASSRRYRDTGGKNKTRKVSQLVNGLTTPLALSYRRINSDQILRATRQNLGEESVKTLRGSASKFRSRTSCPLTSSTSKVTRSARRVRNNIREKVERDTIEHAWRMQRLRECKSDQSVASFDPPDPLLSFSGNWKELSQNWLAELSTSGQQSSRSRSALSEGQTAATLPLVSRFTYKKLVDKIVPQLQIVPQVVKPAKW